MTATPKHAWTFHPPQFSPKAPAITLRQPAVQIGAVRLILPNVEDAKTVAMAPQYEETFAKVFRLTATRSLRDLNEDQLRRILLDIEKEISACAFLRQKLPDSVPFQP